VLSSQNSGFYAQVDAKKIVEGSYISVEFILDGVDGNSFSPPSFKNFNVLSGPSQQNSMSIINGKVSKKLSYSYSIQPKGLGKFSIGSASIKTASGLLKTKPLEVVVKGNTNKPTGGEEIFMRAEVSDSTVYVGQQIILDYILYTTLDVRSIDFAVEPSFDGFYAEDLRSERKAFERKIINGIEYFTKSVKRTSLFPQQTGTYKIDPIPVNAGISNGKSQRSFFFSSQLTPKRIMANGLTIKVNNTPPTKKSFSGAIGKYKMTAVTPKRSLTTDDAIIVNMRITGNGDNKVVMAPQWAASDSLEVYDPNVIQDDVYKNTGEITHSKTFEYLLVPKIPGRYNLTPKFTYFDTDSNAYVTLTYPLRHINVIKGKNNNTYVVKEKEVELAPIFEKATFKKTSTQKFKPWISYTLFCLTLLGASGIFYRGKQIEKSGIRDPETIRKNQAYSVAIKRLEKAQTFKSQNESKAFHEETVVALKKYFADKYKIPALHIKKNELIDALSNQKLSQGVIDSVKDIIQQSEIAIYAPGSASQMAEVYNKAVNVISELEG